MEDLVEKAKELYDLDGCECVPVKGHEGGRNLVLICRNNGENKYVLRISTLGDRTESDYLAETGFVHYLAENGAPVADVTASKNGKYVESVTCGDVTAYVSMFEYAKGMLLCDNGYRYREGAPLEEYFYDTGKTLGAIHRLSKQYDAKPGRISFEDKYNTDYIGRLIPDTYKELKTAISQRLKSYAELEKSSADYGLVHFDFSDGNYHIDMSTGDITVFDFDNCMYCHYMFDLANLWIHGEGWSRFESDPKKRMEHMKRYFDTIIDGYRSETGIREDMLDKLPLFIDLVLVENIIDEFECALRDGEEVDFEDIENAAECLIKCVPYAGIGTE